MEVKELIRQIHRQWLIAKEDRAQKCQAAGLTDVARKLTECSLFKGTEDIAGMAKLLTSTQGLEFCLAANFPTLQSFRLFKPYKLEQYGIYIDAGTITLKNPKIAILLGKTVATVECDTCERHSVVTMHGASATVLASGWAVVFTNSGVSTNIVRRTADHAIIL